MKTPGLLAVLVVRAAAASLEISALTPDVESDWTAVYYDNDGPLLLGNDGTTAGGGVRVFSINGSNPLNEVASVTLGRTKLVTTVYNPDGKGVAISIAQTTSVLQAYTLPDMEEIGGSTPPTRPWVTGVPCAAGDRTRETGISSSLGRRKPFNSQSSLGMTTPPRFTRFGRSTSRLRLLRVPFLKGNPNFSTRSTTAM